MTQQPPSTTPRTDDFDLQVAAWLLANTQPTSLKISNAYGKLLDFARTLELEVQELKKQVENLCTQQQNFIELEEQLSQLKTAGDELAKQLYPFSLKTLNSFEDGSVRAYPNADKALTHWQEITKGM